MGKPYGSWQKPQRAQRCLVRFFLWLITALWFGHSVACPAIPRKLHVQFGEAEIFEHPIPKGCRLKYRVKHKARARHPAERFSADRIAASEASALRNATEMARTAGFRVPYGIPVVWLSDNHVYIFQPYEDGRWHEEPEYEERIRTDFGTRKQSGTFPRTIAVGSTCTSAQKYPAN